ncbi:tyrosine-protein phosphatase [Pseudoclavibacter chungangensis]|uniref:Tyrosine-protein phosphatase n=1 Tax=Pseudoclavibacter chungangensis TaxID=587635 RepID=A0A7J5BZR2_9MICO|nr:tyrosine-protein phosphatase [Pseudoclavibacter chungangensis]
MTRAADEVPIAIAGTHNLRDLGGLPASGGVVAPGRLYRSDALSGLDDSGLVAFAALGIDRIVDLRDAVEIERQPTRLGPAGPEIVHVPVFRAADPAEMLRSMGGSGPDLDGLYAAMLTAEGAHLAEAVTAVADAPTGAVLVHCTAGKDRTGVVVSLVLALLGVPEERIVDDYAATEHNLSGEWLRACSRGPVRSPPRTACRCPRGSDSSSSRAHPRPCAPCFGGCTTRAGPNATCSTADSTRPFRPCCASASSRRGEGRAPASLAAGAAGSGPQSSNRRTVRTTPSSAFDGATYRARSITAGWAFAIANDSPASSSIPRSLR